MLLSNNAIIPAAVRALSQAYIPVVTRLNRGKPLYIVVEYEWWSSSGGVTLTRSPDYWDTLERASLLRIGRKP